MKLKEILLGTTVLGLVAFMVLLFTFMSKSREISIVKGDYQKYFTGASQQVIVYGNSTCHYCKNAREFLRAKNIDFSDRNIEESKDAAAQFKELGGDSVPLIIVGSEKITGFHEKELLEMLARNHNAGDASKQ